MVLDNEDQRTNLLELINSAMLPPMQVSELRGHIAEISTLVKAIKEAPIVSETVEGADVP